MKLKINFSFENPTDSEVNINVESIIDIEEIATVKDVLFIRSECTRLINKISLMLPSIQNEKHV